ncbi:uncharacterized protein LOC130915887 isoform X2 [Corythoichthys intestinalis]|uniref:uncharacterized protein LOC130915887 isoform X2 n=1 Tax=Corythoichthys intestinalis TaxID=161448 RepID=UPI0025A59BBA|nr:uncharacterized protein LOC130915887 isoform X2 [Corythoichthys intestinalis]
MMSSSSNSDYSSNWLACEARFTPHHAEAPLVQIMASPSYFSATALRDSTPTRFHSSAFCWKSRGSICCGCKNRQYHAFSLNCAIPLANSAAVPVKVKGNKPISKLGTFYTEPMHLSDRKRTFGGRCAHPQPDTQSELFSLKCMELQCYIRPLSSILRGLRSGRYSERLSSFQESVAMDRIRRITGVLQNPNMGGHFLNTITKIEEMLRSWFPHIKPDQAIDSSPAKKHKGHRRAPRSTKSFKSASSDSSKCIGRLYASPVSSMEQSELTPSPQSTSQGVTQDNSVSSSTDWPRSTTLHPRALLLDSREALLFKISSPCLETLLKESNESLLAPRRESMQDSGT